MKRYVTIISLIFICSVFAFNANSNTNTDIYGKLKCLCCKKDLNSSFCGHAQEIKAYVDALIDVGLKEDEILIKTAQKYSLDVIGQDDLKKKIEEKLIALAPKNRPQIIIEPLSYNLGEVSKSKGKLEFKVELKNKGDGVLKVTNLKTSCDCTLVKIKTKELESSSFSSKGSSEGFEANISPKDSGELIITTDLTHPHVKAGHLLRTIEVRSNDPVYPVLKIDFSAEIVG